MLLWIGLLAFPNLPVALASEADAESTSSPELVETQTVSFAAASTRSPADPFSMIIMNDPQFGWKDHENMLYEHWDKVRTIQQIYTGNWFFRWPKTWQLDSAGNSDFDRAMQYGEVPARPRGLIINGDLTYCLDFETDGGMKGPYATSGMHLSSILYSRNWYYRNFYVTYLDDSPTDTLKVYAGLGNHDPKWTYYDLACALTLGEEYNDPGGSKKTDDKERKWTNFPTGLSYDFEKVGDHWEGSLSYSWNVRNYHFVQLNNLYPKGVLDLTGLTHTKWLHGMEHTNVFSHGTWLKDDLALAKQQDRKIIICLHKTDGRLMKWWADPANGFDFSNVVAMFGVITVVLVRECMKSCKTPSNTQDAQNTSQHAHACMHMEAHTTKTQIATAATTYLLKISSATKSQFSKQVTLQRIRPTNC